MELFRICSLFLFFVKSNDEFILLSKSKLLIICIVLFISKIFILSFVVDKTIPIIFLEVLIRSSFFKLCTFCSLIISPKLISRLFLLILIVFSLSVHISAYFPYNFKIMPVFPLSVPDVTLTLYPYLNLLDK